MVTLQMCDDDVLFEFILLVVLFHLLAFGFGLLLLGRVLQLLEATFLEIEEWLVIR